MSSYKEDYFQQICDFWWIGHAETKYSQKDDKTSGTFQHVEFEKVKNDSIGIGETNNNSPLTKDDKEVLT